MKVAVHAFNYKNDDLVLRWLANVHPHVDKIYLVYPELPWEYNPAVTHSVSYLNDANPTLAMDSSFANKIQVVKGKWRSDGDQRNHVVDLAQSEGFDYLLVQDIDEFYRPEEMEINLKGIRDNPTFLLYKNPWHIFWKNVGYVLEYRETLLSHNARCHFHERNTTINFSTSFALNLRRGARFWRSRAVRCNDAEILLLEGLCCHLSWVKSDADVRIKIDTWTHCADVLPGWYELKWLNWTAQSKWLAYSDPLSWNRAVPFEGKLPAEIVGFSPGEQCQAKRTSLIFAREAIYDANAYTYWVARQARAAWRHRVRRNILPPPMR